MIRKPVQNSEQVAKRMFYLAWQACRSPLGMGWLQDNPKSSEDDVWNNIQSSGDYPGKKHNAVNKPYADYVFGRMMKFGLTLEPGFVCYYDKQLTPNYQSWCNKYRSMDELFDAAVASL